MNDNIKELIKLARKRYRSQKRRSIKLFLKDRPVFEDYKEIIIECWNKGFNCNYCGKKLKIKDIPPHKDVLSIDHKIPLSSGGGSRKDNLLVCCHQCNLVKGTLGDDTFFHLIEKYKGDEEGFKKYLDESFNSSFSKKIIRSASENKYYKKKVKEGIKLTDYV